MLLSFVYESLNKTSPVCFHTFVESLTSVHQYNTQQASKGDIFYDPKRHIAIWLKAQFPLKRIRSIRSNRFGACAVPKIVDSPSTAIDRIDR